MRMLCDVLVCFVFQGQYVLNVNVLWLPCILSKSSLIMKFYCHIIIDSMTYPLLLPIVHLRNFRMKKESCNPAPERKALKLPLWKEKNKNHSLSDLVSKLLATLVRREVTYLTITYTLCFSSKPQWQQLRMCQILIRRMTTF